MQIQIHAWVSGLVQGVSFRYHTREQARRLGLTGWVRNRADGRVELVAEGNPASLQALLDWCRRGPSGALVDAVEHREMPAEGSFSDFRIEHDRY